MYRPEFVKAYKNSRSKLSIETWEKCIGSKLPQFQTKEEIYAPVPIFVKICGAINSPQGTVKLSVPVTTIGWYDILKKTLEEMTQLQNLNVFTNTGVCIKDLSEKQLYYAGECDLKDINGKVVRLNHMITPPLKMSSDKNNLIKNWWTSNTDKLAQTIAVKIKDMSAIELENACQLNGLVQKTTQTFIENNLPNEWTWNEFITNFGNNKNKITPEHIAKQVLSKIRSGMEHNEEQIHNYQAIASSMGGKSMFKKTSNLKSQYKNSLTLYQDILEDALTLPALGKNIINTIRYGTKETTTTPPIIPNPAPKSEWHPLQSFYQNHYYNVYGKLPTHVMQEYNKTSGNSYQGYKGDAQKAVDYFMLYSGRAIDPIGVGLIQRFKNWNQERKNKRALKNQLSQCRPIPTPNIFARNFGKDKNKFKKLQDGSWVKCGDKISDKLPELIEIDSESKLVYLKDKISKGARLIDLEDNEQISSKLPELIEINSGGPRLIDLEDDEQISSKLPELIEINTKGPRLVDLEDMKVEMPTNDSLKKPLWKSVLPSFDDLLLE